ncbi:putative undecaprenyl-phosphate N-acetylglucosaminyl 1-phosphate transferase [Phycisphaerales bacterium]|nr:putative undecaprenyl-phosphate N-acetylglucosaminyl 1-phosphate transferase [Phycisphaerales bacterium]
MTPSAWAMAALAQTADAASAAPGPTRLSAFEGYMGVLILSFVVTLIATPFMRRLAVAHGIIDRPNQARKVHKLPIAYLGGVAVFAGIMAGVLYSFVGVKVTGLIDWHPSEKRGVLDFAHPPVPYSILLGMTVILLVGVIDDVTGISPRVKIGGQLFAAAALAMDRVGVQMAAGIMLPVANLLGIPLETIEGGAQTILLKIPLPFEIGGTATLNFDLIYWTGTAIIAVAVIGLCNASNLLDGLDGLLSGTTAIAAIGLLFVALGMAVADDGPRDAERIVLCLALLGACLGFLPHNFNPATIFLGDAGSLLLGFVTCVIILMMGDTGKTWLVAAGVIIYALPLIDTTLAIVRRKMEGKSISSADDQHLHHQLKRALGVKGAVFALYGIAGTFAAIGAGIALIRARSVLLLALIFAAYVGVIAIKIARRRAIEAQAAAYEAKVAAGLAPPEPLENGREENAAASSAPEAAPKPHG